jgi:hypothetical protein
MTSKDDIAAQLARVHYTIEPGISQIFRLVGDAKEEGDPQEPIKLLEVNAHTIEAGIMPLYFRPIPENGIVYPSCIVEISPDEFTRVQRGDLPLPNGWRIGQPYQRPAVAEESLA